MSDYISELVCSQLTAECSTFVFLSVSSVKCLVPCKSNVADRGSKVACLVLKDVSAGRGDRKGRLVVFFSFLFLQICIEMMMFWNTDQLAGFISQIHFQEGLSICSGRKTHLYDLLQTSSFNTVLPVWEVLLINFILVERTSTQIQ